MPSAESPQKDVEALLLRERNFRRRPGEVPYPLQLSADILDYDIWDHMFLKSCFRSLTMNHFETPPSMVLDLGCGSGLWAIEAARQWPSSVVIGFDLIDRQPKLNLMDKQIVKMPHPALFRDLETRLIWKQGNFLDGLPFLSDYFDFVRIARLGLAVPEDEWQFVLEEIARVMKSGAVLEIIEEDLIFPYCQSARPRPERPRPSPLNVDLPIPDSISSATPSSRSSLNTLSSSSPWATLDESSDGTLSKKTSLTPLQESPSSSPSSMFPPSIFSPKSPLSLKSQTSLSSRSQTPTLHSFPNSESHVQHTPSQQSYQTHPQDHSKLKAAWDAMLSCRFLAPRLVTVLPFYLSSCFVDVKSHQSLQIPLPPNSASHEPPSRPESSSVEYNTSFDPVERFRLSRTTEGRRSDSDDTRPQASQKNNRERILTWAPMHLARTVRTVQACKEAIYVEYKKLYSSDLPPTVATTRLKDGRMQVVTSKPSAREAFEREWANWENDMTDRIGMRDHVMSQFQWAEPPGESPDWRVWRNNVKLLEDTQHTGDLCRTLRGFVASKP